MVRRAIPRDLLDEVLDRPQEAISEQSGRKVLQSKFDFGRGKMYLVRVIVDER